MQVAVFSTKPYDRQFLDAANARHGHELRFLEPRLTAETARLGEGFPVVCAFVNDQLDRPALETLAAGGTRLVALRCAAPASTMSTSVPPGSWGSRSSACRPTRRTRWRSSRSA
jgi:D-isomer specific 2-hydroxyacid dehydrogenase, catalytic domain